MKKAIIGTIITICALAVFAICFIVIPNGSIVDDHAISQQENSGAIDALPRQSPEDQIDDEDELSWETFDGTEEEYLDEVASRMSQLPTMSDYEWIYPEDGSTPYVDQLLVMTYYRENGEARARQIVEELGGKYLGGKFLFDKAYDTTLVFAEYPPGTDLEAVAETYEAYPEIKSAGPEYDAKGHADSVTNDPYVDDQYYIFNDYFNRAWSSIKSESQATIAVLDTGIDMNHPDLEENIDFTSAFDAWHNTRIPVSFDPSIADPGYEDVDHGTMVAGVACACTDNDIGIAGCGYNARVLPVRITDDNIDEAKGEQGFRWLYLDNALTWLEVLPTKPEAVNMSFSFGEYSDNYTLSIQQRISNLHENYGVVFVASVGNHGTDASVWPAAFDNVIGVGALAKEQDDIWPGSALSNVDICAPGEDILTTYNLAFSPFSVRNVYENGYRVASGTSLAAPQVAAAAALIKGLHPEYSAFDVETALLGTARKLPEMGDARQTNEYGHGALDALAAVMWSNGQDPSTPPGGSPTTGIDDLSEDDIARLIDAQKDVQSIRYKDAKGSLAKAIDQNPEVVAWLYVPDTNVSLPVARHEGDDEYYLVHDSSGEDSPLGCAYMEEADSASFDQSLTVLYGHSFLNTELMFTQLHRFAEPSFFEEHEFFYIIAPDATYTYRVLEAALYNSCNISEDIYEWNETTFQRYLDRFAIDRSDVLLRNLRNTKLDASSDKLVLLSTCTIPAEETTRFIVSGVLCGVQ